MFHEHQSRSLLKSTTWFITAFTITFIVLAILSKDWRIGLLDAIILQILKAFVYYMHERVWNKSNYGQKLKKPTLVMK